MYPYCGIILFVLQSIGKLWLNYRLCVEDCSLDSLDLSGCTALGDLRAAANNYTSINWGSTGQSIWHICIRNNPLNKGNIPLLTQFPVLRQLLIWNTNQTGTFVCHSSEIQEILSDMNHFTNADISGCTNLGAFDLSGNQLTSLDLGTAYNLTDLQLKDCSLAKSVIDYILLTLDQVGQPNGTLVLTGNEAPSSSSGIVHRDNIKIKGWTISITEPGQPIPVTDITITSEGGVNTTSSDKGTLQLNAEIIPTISTDNTVLWSITSGANLAKVDNNGQVTALHNGIITVTGTVHNNSEIYDEMVIIISNQINSDDINFP
jgi:hypothetical protein